MPQFTISVDGEEWTVGSKQAHYDAVHTIAGALLAGADEIALVKRDRPSFYHDAEDVRQRIEQLQQELEEMTGGED